MRRLIIALVASGTLMSAAYAQTAVTTTPELFVTAQPTDVLSYNLVGLNITNAEDETVGEIKDRLSLTVSSPVILFLSVAFLAWESAM